MYRVQWTARRVTVLADGWPCLHAQKACVQHMYARMCTCTHNASIQYLLNKIQKKESDAFQWEADLVCLHKTIQLKRTLAPRKEEIMLLFLGGGQPWGVELRPTE